MSPQPSPGCQSRIKKCSNCSLEIWSQVINSSSTYGLTQSYIVYVTLPIHPSFHPEKKVYELIVKTFDEFLNCVSYLEIVLRFQHLRLLGFRRWEGSGLAGLLGRLWESGRWELPQNRRSVTLWDRGESGGKNLDITQLVRIWVKLVVGGVEIC